MDESTSTSGRRSVRPAAIVGGIVVVAIFVFTTLWTGRVTTTDTEQAVRSVSLLYLDELAGRREQVVASNLQGYIDKLSVAIDLMGDEDVSDTEHLQAYQARMKRLYNLEKFAFVDTDGIIYTSTGTQTNIDEYRFDYRSLTEADISILNLESTEKKVIIALPLPTPISFEGRTLTVAFMEIDMKAMLAGVSMESGNGDTTFCNIYTAGGIALSDTVLGGLAVEDNLLEAMEQADFEEGYSYEAFFDDFSHGRSGEVSFSYGSIRETLSFVPVKGTDWQLTYLIRESVISEKIASISDGIILRSVVQSLLTMAALLATFAIIIAQNRRNAQLILEKETAEAENRARNQELERRLVLQEQLLEKERSAQQQHQLITALASDYRGVYYVDLDIDEGVCYQAHADLADGSEAGDRFSYEAFVRDYAERYVDMRYRDGFLEFTRPEAIRDALAESLVISYRYVVSRRGRETYEMVRFAGVRHPEDRGDGTVHKVGMGFADVDRETRASLEQRQALSDALDAAERANTAKTSFLSNMSHEIRTPMNAIIGLDSIALNDPATPPQTREYLEKIGASAQHLLGLINDILDMSRIESGRLVLKNEEFSFSGLLKAINTMFSGQCEERGLTYRCRIKGEVDSHYIGDTMKLRQVLINILGNAVKFTPEGGSVSLGVERLARFDGHSTLRFTIADTGVGMSEDFIPHIFDTFTQEDASSTTRYGSSGLGLAITKSLVEMMNGDIQVESTKGEGSTFVVTVTLADCPHDVAIDADAVQPHEMSVLIVDDDPIACEHARLTLEHAGIASEVVEGGAEAVEMVRLRHARRNPYNLILVDWRMPEMDGVECARQIRQIIGDDSAIIILTAYRWDDVHDEAIDAGVDSFISKPLFAEPVLEEFRGAMKRRAAEGRQAELVELEGRRVLLAEDVDINAEIMVMVLEMRGIETDIAENGRIAVEMFAGHPEGYYDAILMDMRMPEMDGLEATRTIRAMDRRDAAEIPIVALTANAFDEDVQRSLQAGLNAHLSKPVQPEELYETLGSLMASRP